MNWITIFRNQKPLDDHIEKLHPVQEGEERIPKKIVALQVEVGELANEVPQAFKFWKADPQMDREKTLFELVDISHFAASIGLDFNYDINSHQAQPVRSNTVLDLISDVMTLSCWLRGKDDTFNMFPVLLNHIDALQKALGFTEEEVMDAYMTKNKINFDRQAEAY